MILQTLLVAPCCLLNKGTLESELALDLLLEEGGDNLHDFLLAAAKRSPPTLDGKTIKGEIELPDPSHIQ